MSSNNVFSTDDVNQLNTEEDVDIEMHEEPITNDLENGDQNLREKKKDQDQDQEKEKKQQQQQKNIDPLIPPIPNLTRADKTLDELFDLLDDPDFTPIIPDAVTDYYLSKSGLALSPNNDESIKIKRLLALATQKFISDIATDAYEYSRIRSNSAVYAANNPQARSRALLMATMAKARGATTTTTSSSSAQNNNTDVQNNDDGTETGDVNTTTGSNLNPNGASQNKEKVTLTMDDLSSALDEYGLNINRPQFYR
jgi:transcription initiation factor TFIID subunit 10